MALSDLDEVSESVLAQHRDQVLALPLVKVILDRLTTELGPELAYHNVAHTLDVLNEAIRFALLDRLSEREILLLGIAAAFHDAGFLVSRTENENLAAEFAQTAMEKDGGFKAEEIDLVHRMIEDTRLIETRTGPQQVPSSELSKYLLDADLSNLGRPDFFEKNDQYRREVRYSEDIGLQKSLELLISHSWHTPAAERTRTDQKLLNIEAVRTRLAELKDSDEHVKYFGVSLDNLGFLTRLPLLLTSSIDPATIIDRCLNELGTRLDAEAGTVFLCEESSDQLMFWALSGGDGELRGKRMPKGRGLVGWVIDNNEPIIVDDVSSDPRFFGQIDKEGGFTTRDVMCVPLRVRGNQVIGAIQILNSRSESGFDAEDLIFVEHVAYQLSMAIDNARLYSRLLERNKQLAILDQRKNEMISIITHEFQTPLNVIKTSAEMLSGDMIKEQLVQEKIGKTLLNGVTRLSKLIGDIRKVSHVIGNSLEVNLETYPVADLFSNAATYFKDILAGRELTLILNEESEGLQMTCDPALIAVVLNNLISNAIRFTQNGGEITLRAREQAGLVEIAVEDTGIGIPADQFELIFEKFYEVGNIMEHSSGSFEFRSAGLGLGLPAAKAILEAHGTGIEVESRSNLGSRFFFRLPT